MIYEKKLIDADKLKDDLWKYALTCKNTSFEFAGRMSDIEKIIDEQPTITLCPIKEVGVTGTIHYKQED